MTQTFARQDIGYLLTAYADGQLAPEGVMWVEEQLDRNADLRAKLKEIRQLQAGLRTAFAGGAPAFVLDLPRRDALLASAANPPRKKINFPRPLWIGLAASILVMVAVMSTSPVGVVREMARMSPEARARADADARDYLAKAEMDEPSAAYAMGEKESGRGHAGGGGFALGAPAPAASAYDDPLVANAKPSNAPMQAPAATASPVPTSQFFAQEGVNRTAEKLNVKGALATRRAQNSQVGEKKPETRLEKISPALELHKSLTPQNELLVIAEDLHRQPMGKDKAAAPPKTAASTPPALAGDRWNQEHKLLSESTREAQVPGLQLIPDQELGGVPKDWEERDRFNSVAKRSAPPPAPAAAKPSAPPAPVVVGATQPANAAPADGEALKNKTQSFNGTTSPMPTAAAKKQAAAKPAESRPDFVGDLALKEEELLVKADAKAGPLEIGVSDERLAANDDVVQVAPGREEAVSNLETGSTGAFMAVGAGGGATLSATEKEVADLRKKRHVYLRQLGEKPDESTEQLERQLLAAENRLADERLEQARQSNNEKTHIAQVARDAAFKLNVNLAEQEDDLGDADAMRRELLQQQAQLDILKDRYPRLAQADSKPVGKTDDVDAMRKRVADQRAQLDSLRSRYPKIAAEITDEKQSASFLQGVVGAVRANPQGEQDLLMLTLGKGDQVEADTEFIVFRGNDYIVRVRAEKVDGGMAACRVIPDSWNSRGLKIQQGDLAQDRLGGPPTRPVVSARSLLIPSATVDPQQSLAALRAPVTLDGTLSLAQSLRLIGGEKVGYALATGAEWQMDRQVQVSLRDEPAARGVLRAVRSAGLQAQFTGGLVHLDAATRPLDPSDTQGFDLPSFKDLFGTSPMQATAVDAIQTVAIDADTASYQYAKARIAAGQPVDPATIKPEHFINAMPMDYPAAQGTEAFSLYAEAAPSPFARAGTAWGPRTALVSIGAVAKPAAADERKPLALTLAIDCSGSMAQAGGLERIQRGLLAFVEHLRAEDRVAIVAFGDQARVVLPATPGNDRAALINALENLVTGGATNAAEGLGLAYQLAAETAAVGVESRVLLATDGGTVAGADDLLRRVTAFKDRGITLVVVGTGQTYRAGPLQELATKGDGQHYYVGSDEDAQALFTGKLLPDRLAVLAKDAKLQVTWNPQRVSHARLIGYDQRRLAAKDFRDNTVDAGELSQDTQVTALFEVLLVDGGAGPLGTAAVRYKDMRRDQVRELACPLPGTILQSQPSDRLRLLACAAATAEWLQRGWWSNVHLITPQEIAAQLARCPQPIAAELRAMVK